MIEATCQRVLIAADPYLGQDAVNDAIRRNGAWECRWIDCPSAGPPPFVTAYRRRFELQHDAVIRIHVSADERYELYVDGRRVGRGSERGDPTNWFYESYDLKLPAGGHIIVARVWSLGAMAPDAQMTVCPGFILGAEGDYLHTLSTGLAPWEAKTLRGITFLDPFASSAFCWQVGAQMTINGADYDWGFEQGGGEGWKPARTLRPGMNARCAYVIMQNTHLMRPATLPPMIASSVKPGRVRYIGDAPSMATDLAPIRMREHQAGLAESWQAMLDVSKPLTVPPQKRYRAIIDLDTYVCAYPVMTFSGGRGTQARLRWGESLYTVPRRKAEGALPKGNRDEIEEKYFSGLGDTFIMAGGGNRAFAPLWWRSGRYLELMIETGPEPLVINGLELWETRYPFEVQSEFRCSDERLLELVPAAVRSWQQCAHETYIDCPHYEQLQYSGDGRLQALVTYALTNDDRLARKAIAMFAASRLPSGATRSRYPGRTIVMIPTFSLLWIGMVYDYALWRGDRDFVAGMLPAIRNVVDWLWGYRNADGLIKNGDGMTRDYYGGEFIDWVPEWSVVKGGGWAGNLPAGFGRPSGPTNWLFVWATSMAAELEDMAGDQWGAARMRAIGKAHAQRSLDAFWDAGRRMLANDIDHKYFSEHTQCLAILSGQLDAVTQRLVGAALLDAPDLARTTISFSHYLFEAYRILGRTDKLMERLDIWHAALARGMKTYPEWPEPTRSDCHGWGAHPLYHYFATILGIRPSSLGFNKVCIRPCLGTLTHAQGSMAHPRGAIEVEIQQAGDGKSWGWIRLPDGIEGVFEYQGVRLPLQGGSRQEWRHDPADMK